MRQDGRSYEQLRPCRITRGYTEFAPGSVLIECGRTRVLCTASIEAQVPPFAKQAGHGWVTAEYAMLPGATPVRGRRTADGRSKEIQRLIGRALRAVTILPALGERTIVLDCDVLQADGGTRTAAITGAFVALADALETLRPDAGWAALPLRDFLAAVSVGIVDGTPLLDLTYDEDVRADVDFNVVAMATRGLVEVQGTAEGAPFTRRQLDELLDLAERGLAQLLQAQRDSLGPLAARIGVWVEG